LNKATEVDSILIADDVVCSLLTKDPVRI